MVIGGLGVTGFGYEGDIATTQSLLMAEKTAQGHQWKNYQMTVNMSKNI